MALFEVNSAATAGIVDALIAAEAMRTAILLMSELHKRVVARRVTVLPVYLLSCVGCSGYGCSIAPHKPWFREGERRFRMRQMSHRPPTELTAPKLSRQRTRSPALLANNRLLR
jgi:hypothetical protein